MERDRGFGKRGGRKNHWPKVSEDLGEKGWRKGNLRVLESCGKKIWRKANIRILESCREKR